MIFGTQRTHDLISLKCSKQIKVKKQIQFVKLPMKATTMTANPKYTKYKLHCFKIKKKWWVRKEVVEKQKELRVRLCFDGQPFRLRP